MTKQRKKKKSTPKAKVPGAGRNHDRDVQRKVLQRARMATVAFGVHDGKDTRILGSGVIVDRSGVVLTARHVVEGVECEVLKARNASQTLNPVIFVPQPVTNTGGKINVQFKSASPGKISRLHPVDLAVLEIDPAHIHEALSLDFDANPEEGDRVATCGFPYGVELNPHRFPLSSFLHGNVSAIPPHPIVPPAGRTHYMLQMPVNPGNSGGAVFDPDTGCVFGIVSRRYQPAGMPTGLCVAESVHYVRQQIEALRKAALAK